MPPIGILLFGKNEAMNFISLNDISTEIADFIVQKSSGFLPGSFEDAHNGFCVQSGESGNGADAHTLNEQVNHLFNLFCFNPQAIQRLRFTE